MRYMIVTYDETGLPTKNYDMFEVLGRFLTEEGLNCGLADLHSPSEVMEYVSPNRGLLEKLLVSIEIIGDELSGVPEIDSESENRIRTAYDELATMRAMIEEELHDPGNKSEITAMYFDEADTIPYLIPPATPIAIVGEEPCEKVNS